MSNSFWDLASEIYSAKTKDYFSEVLSSYDNGNFRSALVMLYSLVICDLLYKLQELKDMYDDSVAIGILNEIDKSRSIPCNKPNSNWEKDLIRKINEKTNLFEYDTYVNILHLTDHRNLCAHPALNVDYDLFSPNRDTVASHIRNMLEGVFIKPPLFIKNIIDTLVEDLSRKKDIYHNDYNNLSNYLQNKYFSKMTDKMYVSVFKAIWKFVYVLDDADCKNNRNINNKCLRIMLDQRSRCILEASKADSSFCHVQIDESKSRFLLALCCNIQPLYSHLSKSLQIELVNLWRNNSQRITPLTWFLYDNFYDYYKFLIEDENCNGKSDVSMSILEKMSEYFRKMEEKMSGMNFLYFIFRKVRILT